MREEKLNTEVMFLPGAGPKKAAALKADLEIVTVEDLLRTYPFRYVDRSSINYIASITSESAYVQILGKVIGRTLYSKSGGIIYSDYSPVSNKFNQPLGPKGGQLRFNNVSRMVVLVSDPTGTIEIVFFSGIKYVFNKMNPEFVFTFFGKPSFFNGKYTFVHPEFDVPSASLLQKAKNLQHNTEGASPYASSQYASSSYSSSTYASSIDNHTFSYENKAGFITGVYPSSEKLKKCGVTNKKMVKFMSEALTMALHEVQETLPDYLLRDLNLVPARYALRNIHFPESTQALDMSTYRLKFEELFFLQLALLKQKYASGKELRGIVMKKVGEPFNKCFSALPYELTGAQKRVIKEIRADLLSGKQMNRLLQGDVGSGKTMVAVFSCLLAVGNGYQACLMAPTEVLARQHFENIQKYLKDTGATAAILTGSSKKAERDFVHSGIQDGSIDILIGTHALIEDDVVFRNLGMAVIDEQHRFGVEQRARLWRKGSGAIPPHILVMTATPIPRTLAMTYYGDLDVSVIDELPPGRKPVKTLMGNESKRFSMNAFLKQQIEQGRQVFIVYPLIFESEKLDYQNLEKGYEDIQQEFPFPPYKTAIVHGKQSNEEKIFNMKAFSEGRADILVSTTVIEVGVDVPNASVMVIESSERFGLSQLHQLRGRVGRGGNKSYCILMHGDKISRESRKRLELMCNTEDGFKLAEEDLKMRGPGDMEGTQQSGLPVKLHLASLTADADLLAYARDIATRVLDSDPLLQRPEHQVLVNELRRDKYNIKDYSKIS